MVESDLNSVRALRPRIPAASPVTSSRQEDPPASASEEERQLAVVGALRAAVIASSLQFNAGNSAEDLLVSLLKQRLPSLLSQDDGTTHALEESVVHESQAGGKRSDKMRAEHSVVDIDITDDPYLLKLLNGRKVHLACGSVRQNISGATRVDKLSSVSTGDVVAYDELSANGDKSYVMAAVVAIASQRTRNYSLPQIRSHKFGRSRRLASAARDAVSRPLAASAARDAVPSAAREALRRPRAMPCVVRSRRGASAARPRRLASAALDAVPAWLKTVLRCSVLFLCLQRFQVARGIGSGE